MSYFAFSTDYSNYGNWPKVSQTLGTGLSQRLVKATARVKCVHTSDSYANGYSMDYLDGADLYFKLSAE